MAKEKTQKIKFMYEIAIETDTVFKASLFQKFIETYAPLIQQQFPGKTNKIVVRLIGKDWKGQYGESL